jgi:hypothetical protein
MNILKYLHHILIGQFQMHFWKRDNTAQKEAQRARIEEDNRRARVASGIADVNTTFAQLLNPNLKAQKKVTPQDMLKTDPDLLWSQKVGWYKPEYLMMLAQRKADEANSRRRSLKPDYSDSPFLDALQQSFLDFATPEVQRQAGGVQRSLRQGLARRGTLESSVGAEKSADLDRQKAEALARVSARGQEIRSQRAADIEKARTGIVAQLEATANSAAAANDAINSAQILSATQEFKPLGKLIDVGLSTGADVLRQQSMPGASPTIFSRRGRGSSKTIN